MSISSFRGSCPEAVHYYATLHAIGTPRVKYSVHYVCDETDIARLRAHYLGRTHLHPMVGETAHQFWYENEARRASIVAFDALSGPDDVLLESAEWTSGPVRPIRGSQLHIDCLTPIWRAYESWCKVNDDRDYPKSLYDYWDEYMDRFEKLNYSVKTETKEAVVRREAGAWHFEKVEEW